MNILVINCGSSSLKYQLINSSSEEVLAKGLCERITIDGRIKHTSLISGKSITIDYPMPDHQAAVEMVLKELTDKDYGVINSLDEINAVGHRIVHGGEKFASSTIINDEVMKAIEDCNDLAPLHNPANLIGIRACKKLMPSVPMVAVFDTAFHQTMPKEAYLYGLPYDYYKEFKVRRYGFHGTSHSFVSKRCMELLDVKKEDSKIVVCHLGNGASVCAVKGGKSIDTSMGLTPLEGLVMGTRSGSIDPAIIEYLSHKLDKTLEEVLNILNKESGVYGLSGISSDFRDIGDAIDKGDEKAKAAMEVFCYNVAKYVGAYSASMNGIDAVVFTAGIGENNPMVRDMVCKRLSYLGIELDSEANQVRGDEKLISTSGSTTKVYVIPTNEELAIARETVALI